MNYPASEPLRVSPKRGRGRPRDEGIEERIKASALSLLADGGLSALTLEAVCATANVTKASFYRRWKTPLDAVAAAFTELWDDAIYIDTGNLIEDLLTFAIKLLELYAHPTTRACLAVMVLERHAAVGASSTMKDAGLRRRERNSALLEKAIGAQLGHSLTSPLIILNVLNGLAHNAYSLRWQVSHDELRLLLSVLVSGTPPRPERHEMT